MVNINWGLSLSTVIISLSFGMYCTATRRTFLVFRKSFPAAKKKNRISCYDFWSSWSFKYLLPQTIFKNQTKAGRGHFDSTTEMMWYTTRGSALLSHVQQRTPSMACVWNCTHLLSCRHVSMCTCLNYGWRDLVTLVAVSAVRMFHRLLCKVPRFVCLLFLSTIKTRGQAIGITLFTCRGCDYREMKQSMSGEQMFPHTNSPQKSTY